MKKSLYTMESARQLTQDTWELVLSGDTSAIHNPGEFVNLELPGHFLRRPISICDWNDHSVTLLVKVVGQGTRDLVALAPGTRLDVLSGLGNGFDPALSDAQPVLVGGGIGIAPLCGLAKRLIARGVCPTVVLGFRTAADTFYIDEFTSIGCKVIIATEDGSLGVKGFVTDAVRTLPDAHYVYTCGPLPMLKAVHSLEQLTDGQFSFEARMGCGFGACMGCTIPTKDGYKRVCKDGPILMKEEIVW